MDGAVISVPIDPFHKLMPDSKTRGDSYRELMSDKDPLGLSLIR